MTDLAVYDDGGTNRYVVPQSVLDDYLSPEARQLVVGGMNANTLAAYAWQWHKFRAWCERHKRTFAPASQATMIEYLNSWRSRPIHNRCKCELHRPAPTTMWLWYSAVRFYHAVGSPPLPWEIGKQLELAMISYSNEMVDEGWVPTKAPRAYDSDVTAMIDALDLETGDGLRDRAIILCGFYTAARASDLATYRITDIERRPNGVEFQLRNSKTNKKVGKKIEVRRMRYNLVNPTYCGVRALDAYTGWLAAKHGITEGALFRPFDKHHNLLRGPQDQPGYKMTATNISRAVKMAAIDAGLPNAQFMTEHSLRRGRATQQRELGIDPIEIARAYGWVPGGSILEYLEEAEGWSPTAPGSVGALG
jgi:integrase